MRRNRDAPQASFLYHGHLLQSVGPYFYPTRAAGAVNPASETRKEMLLDEIWENSMSVK